MSTAPAPHLPSIDRDPQALLLDRRRRQAASLPPLAPVRAIPEDAAAIAARVQERWRAAPSYGELPAANVAAAQTAAEAAQSAQAAAEAVLACYEAVPQPEPEPEPFDVFADPFFTESGVRASFAEPGAPGSFTVEHHAPLPARTELPKQPERAPFAPCERPSADALAEATVPPAQALPAKLIEFPRELVAPRKQRPRLAEGPLLDPALDAAASSEQALDGNARICSRAAGEPAAAPAMTDIRQPDRAAEPTRRRKSFAQAGADETGWGAIRLGEHPRAEAAVAGTAETAPALEGLAPIRRRLMAAIVDGSIVSACFLLSVLVFASSTTHIPSGKAALASALLALAVQAAFYGWLFMSFGGGSTPGMRYARIALCTFRDENPTRRELQSRVPATALALLPLGVGLLWALLDEDHLGWHDRMTRTYQRSYR